MEKSLLVPKLLLLAFRSMRITKRVSMTSKPIQALDISAY